MSKRSRKRKSRKKLAYGAIISILICVCFLVYFFLCSSPIQVAIVDHLSFFPEQRNQTFVNTCTNILEEGGLTWAYYKGEEITVDFYRKLPSHGADLIILRVHSAIMKTENGTISILGLFTSEPYSVEAAKKYPEDILDNRLVRAFFSEGSEEYFGIVPKFVEKSMKGKFKDTIIVMVGCEGLGYVNSVTLTREIYTDMAKAFVKKGAKVYIGWDGLVSIGQTDLATVRLLRSLILKKRTIKEAVQQINYDIGPDPTYNSTLKYYPSSNSEVENYTISNIKNYLITNVFCTPPAPKSFRRSRYAIEKSYQSL
jgi:hypothetical protein